MTFTETRYDARREWKTFAATDGSYTEQTLTHVGAGVEANAIEGDEHQRRSYPDGDGGPFKAAGFEYVRGLDLVGRAEPLADEAVALLSAPQCPSGRFTVILDPSQLYMQVHESCGHPSELDRVYGTEASYAGTSFLTTDKLDEGFRYGSDLIDIVADATAPGGMGTFGWDDEGVAAASVPIVREGIFVGYLTSRETAPRIGRQSGGAMRADGWNRIPLIRMTNLNLLPKPGMSLDEIVADTDDGFYLASNRSWSIDDRRLNFQFATEIAYEIKNGKKGRLFKNPTYTGHHLRVLALVRRGRRRAELRDARDAELRQGRARPGRQRRARLPPGPASGTSRWASASGERRPRSGEHPRARRTGPCLCRGGRRDRSRGRSSPPTTRGLTRFANSEIHQNVAESNAEINLRFVVGRRVGVASSNRVDDEGLRRLAETAGGDRPELRGARGLGRPAGADADPARSRRPLPRQRRARRRSSGPKASER